jgi:hypothetical protein
MSYFFLKNIYESEIEFCSSHHIEHNGENGILNEYHMREINHFVIMWNGVAYDVGWTLMCHHLIGC